MPADDLRVICSDRCGWQRRVPTFRAARRWHNVPCPACGANVLKDHDLRVIRRLRWFLIRDALRALLIELFDRERKGCVEATIDTETGRLVPKAPAPTAGAEPGVALRIRGRE